MADTKKTATTQKKTTTDKPKRAVSFKNKSTGTEPGQNQRLAVSFKSRTKNKVTLHVSFTARSLGMDMYTKDQRHNHASIIIKRKNSKGDKVKVDEYSWNYQCGPGHQQVAAKSANFSFTAKDDEDYVYIYYDNDRVGVDDPWYGPKTTGKVNDKYLGKLNIKDTDRISIKLYKGGAVGDVFGLPDEIYITKGADWTVPKFTPIDENGHYKFTGYDTSDSWQKVKYKYKTKKKKKKKKKQYNIVATRTGKRKVNTTTPSVKPGKVYKDVKKSKKLWACWEPTTFIYQYWPSQAAVEKYLGWPLDRRADPYATDLPTEPWTELTQYRKKGDPGILVPDIRIETTDPNSKYYKAGYIFKGWKHHKNDYDPYNYEEKTEAYHKMEDTSRDCSFSANTNCWPIYEANTCKLYFDYGYEDKKEFVVYTTDEEYDLKKQCTDPNKMRMGLSLLGWSYTKPDKDYYLEDDTPPEYIPYNGTFKGIAKVVPEGEDNSITLYAVWGINATLYVYTNLGASSLDTLFNINPWKRATPYVYTNGRWVATEMSIYTSQGGKSGPDWKV